MCVCVCVRACMRACVRAWHTGPTLWPLPATWTQQVTPQPNKPSYQKPCNVNKLYLNPLKHTYTLAHISSDAFLVTRPQGPVLCPKFLIPSRKQAPPKPQTTSPQSSLTITSPHRQLKNQEGQKFRVQIVKSNQDHSEIGPIIHLITNNELQM